MSGKLLGMLALGTVLACNSPKKDSSMNEIEQKEYDVLEYSELEKLNIPLPYKYQYSNGNKSVFVYGSYHTSNPNDSAIMDIESNLLAFKPDLVMYEGDGISFEDTKEKSIEYYFEMGLVRYLSHHNGITDFNIEPPTREKYDYLLKKYKTNEVFLASIGLQFTLLLVSQKEVDFSGFYTQFVDGLAKEGFPINHDLKSVDYFYKTYEEFYNRPFDLKTFDYETVEIKFNKTHLNKINQDAAHFRDLFMLGTIEKKLTEYNRIYVQVGGRHAIVWEPAVKNMLEGK